MANVLVVDDEIYIRELIKKVLTSHGHKVLEAQNGHTAMDILNANRIDVAIIDLVMPEKGGIETMMEIRETNEQIKLIAISGKISTVNDSIQGLAQQFHVDAVLSKPFDIDQLLNLIEGVL